MKISLNWIGDFIELNPDLPQKGLVETITLSVCEVEGYAETGTHLKNVVVAEVLEIAPHPETEKLTIVEINCGKGKEKVVCGAKNLKVGDKVPYVPAGVTLPGNLKIKKAEIRGVESNGMLCAEDELYFSDNHEGLMILPDDAINGCSLDLIYPDQVDVIIEVDNKTITHRPDLWGHYGFARELGTIYGLPMRKKVVKPENLEGKGERLIEVEVVESDLVPRFSGVSIKNVEVKPSRTFMRHRLTRIGLRSINNLVDLTNYVMLEYGQPMHAFDAEKIPGNKLTVKLAEEGSKVTTLHNKEVTLGQNDLTICDAEGASVVAGVVGGLNSGVTDKTTSIFLEAANWDPVNIRKTSTRIGLRTDASQRFEKALDPEMTMLAIQKAVKLLRLTSPDLELRGDPVDVWGRKIKPITVKTSFDFISRRLGKQINSEEICGILTRLDFKISDDGSEILVEVPSHRRTKDVSIPEDLVEEVGRIHGFNNIKPQAPMFPIMIPVFNQEHQFRLLACTVLLKTGFHEVYNYPLTNQEAEDFYGIQSTAVMRLRNPVADHQTQMRTSLLPHFVRTIKNNQKITFDFRNFEIGRIYYKNQKGKPEEPRKLIVGLSTPKSRTGGAFFQLKSQIFNLLVRLQIPDIVWESMENLQTNYQHKHISAAIYSRDHFLGTIFSFSPEYMDLIGLKEDVCIAELDFDKMFELDKTEYAYKEPPKYPSVNFEISVMASKRTYYQEISDLIRSTDELAANVAFLSVYHPEEYPGQKSVSISIEFRSENKTLEPHEVSALQEKVISNLAERGYHLRPDNPKK